MKMKNGPVLCPHCVGMGAYYDGSRLSQSEWQNRIEF